MAAFDDTMQRMAALGKQRDQDFQTAAAALPASALSYGMSYPVGARVMDLVTGQAGTVTSGKRESIIIPPAGNHGS